MHAQFAHLLPNVTVVWKRFLALHGLEYSLLEYDIRVGLGRDPGDIYPENIRKMAIDLSYRRIDCVAYQPNLITIIEITPSAGFTALGQIYSYPILYALTFQPHLPLKALLVCEDVQSDIVPVLDSLMINYVVV